jgi:NAD(P)-dependent dehydrogenase (short-subunit alcohol dehydrogenase family)
MDEFEGRVAVVTGAASGIGLATATRFAQEGMRVVLADIERDSLEAAVSLVCLQARAGRALSGERCRTSCPRGSSPGVLDPHPRGLDRRTAKARRGNGGLAQARHGLRRLIQ